MMNIQSILDSRKGDIAKIFLTDKVDDTINFFSKIKCKAAIAVDEKQQLCGVVSEHDLVSCLGEFGESAKNATVEEILSLDLIVCTPETTIEDAIKLMSENKMHHLPVVSEAGHLAGFVSVMEVMTNYISLHD